MVCLHCEALQKRVERLEKELGIRRYDQEIAALVTRLEVSAVGARIMLRLYAAGGKMVTNDALMTVSSTNSYDTMKVQICRLRKLLGEDVLETGPNGTACYRLTANGLSRVLAALEPVLLQDAVMLV